MSTRDDALREIFRGLDGLVMLSQWELTLAKDLRQKAENLLSGEIPEPPAKPSPEKPK